MKTKIIYLLSFLLFVILVDAQTTVNYVADNTTNFSNPERGFWKPEYPVNNPLTLNNLNTYRSNGYSMVSCRYVISTFKTSPLSTSLLNQFQQDLNVCRQAGLKMIPIFMYNESEQETDAAYDIVINHLDQLKPIIQSNVDVIAYWAGGLIGAWGEWHTSSNNLINNSCFATVNSNTIGIHNKILEILPKSRMSVVRTPRQWFGLYGRQPVSAQEAFTQTNKARTGFKNHYFSGNLTDGTTWMMPTSSCQYADNNDTINKLQTFVRNQCAYTVYEMECDTNLPNTDPTYSGTTALNKMQYQRLSTGNVVFNLTMINRWKNENVFDEMSRRMGYRFKLINSSFPNSTLQGSNLSFNFTIKNDGFASPYNPRDVELVLRAKSNGAVTRLKINKDPRFWLPDNGNIVINESIAIPANLSVGEYDLLLNFPDPMSAINTRPEYSIRLANEDVWEATTGYNSLKRTITVGSALVDNQYPTAPGNLSATSITKTSFVLSWQPSSDNVGVTGYKIYKNGQWFAQTTNTSVNVTGLAPGVSSTMIVQAYDAANNYSSESNLIVTTLTDNLLINPGFEEDLSIGWTYNWNNALRSTFSKNSGANGIEIGYSDGGRAQPVTAGFNVGSEYTLSAWCKLSGYGTNGGGTIGVICKKSDGTQSNFSIAVANAGSFEKKTLKFTVPQLTTLLEVYAYYNGGGTVKLYVDDFGLVSGSNALAKSVDQNLSDYNTNQSDKENLEMKIYPNPTSQNATLEYNLLEKNQVSIVIYDLMGKVVSRITNENQNAGSYKTNISTSNLKDGIYLVKLITNNYQFDKKLIVKNN
jgi:Domain of unknown function (DUF4832)/Domain of unknown function (DUF4874)/Secretion system C-terminal sorting domain/Carbohydrate binding domain/Fibronectin type III domain